MGKWLVPFLSFVVSSIISASSVNFVNSKIIGVTSDDSFVKVDNSDLEKEEEAVLSFDTEIAAVTSTPSPTSKPKPTIFTTAVTLTPTLKLSSTPTPSTATPTPTPTTVSPSATPTSVILPTQTPTPIIEPVVYSSEAINSFIDRFAGQYGVDPNVLRHIAVCESNFNPLAVNGDYVGLYQFGQSAWISYRSNMGEDTNTLLRTDAEEAVQTAAYVLSINKSYIWPSCVP